MPSHIKITWSRKKVSKVDHFTWCAIELEIRVEPCNHDFWTLSGLNQKQLGLFYVWIFPLCLYGNLSVCLEVSNRKEIKWNHDAFVALKANEDKWKDVSGVCYRYESFHILRFRSITLLSIWFKIAKMMSDEWSRNI